MIDIWLIFAQTIPFIEVLLHTFMDCMRVDEDRDINHHGQAISIKPSSVGEGRESSQSGDRKVNMVSPIVDITSKKVNKVKIQTDKGAAVLYSKYSHVMSGLVHDFVHIT